LSSQPSNMLTEAVAAVRVGDRHHARELLSRLLRSDSSNAEYWLWMSAVVDTTREKIYCLESALRLDPTNRTAIRGLVVTGAKPAAESDLVNALKIPPRKIEPLKIKPTPEPKAPEPVLTTFPSPAPERAVLRRRRQPLSRFFVTFVLAGVGVAIVAGLYYFVIPMFRPLSFGVASTLPPPSPTATGTPLPGTPTATPIPAATRIIRTPVPSDLAGTPLALLIPSTPTPTPLAGYTPHPSYEAYDAGVTALLRDDYEQAIEFFDQVIDLDPDLADVHYLKAEAYRLSGNVADAIRAYDRATQTDPDFAPAYLGRGRALMERNEQAAFDDFERALDRDPLLIETNLEIARYYQARSLWQVLERTMQAAIEAGARTPAIYIYLSNAQHNLHQFEGSLISALQGSADDPGLLEGYLAVGRAYVAVAADNLEPEYYPQAIWPLQTYLAYRPDDYQGWGLLSRAYLGSGQLEEALQAANVALGIYDRYAPAYRARGMTNTKMGEYDLALTDMKQAERYGQSDFELTLETGRVMYHLGKYTEALRDYINPAINLANEVKVITVKERKLAEGYALRALIYETNPDNRGDAVREWNWILSLTHVLPETRAMAEQHYSELIGEGPTRTPTPSRTPTDIGGLAPSRTPSPTPSATSP
jgi:tetratricopeptide (TPR) repeat protein